MSIKYNKNGVPTTIVGIKSITLNQDKQFVCVTESGSKIFIPESQFIECK